MKHKLWKKLSVALVSVMALTSCRLIDNIVNRVLITVVDQLPFLVNVIDLMALQEGEGDDIPITQFEDPPLQKNKRADISYITNALLIPKKLEVDGIPYNLEFSIPEGIAGFHEFVLGNEDLPDDFQEELPLQLEVYVLIPVGTSTILGNTSSLEDLEDILTNTSQTDLASAVNQDSMEVELPITIRAGANHTKMKTFYLKLVKTDFGGIIVDVVFESDFLLNVFDAVNDEITSLEEKPEEPDQSVSLEYFKETLAIPKSIELEDIGTINFEVTTNYPHKFFQNTIEKSIEELDPNNEEFSGNVEIHTFTPVGDEPIPGTVHTIEDFKDYFEDFEAKELYNKAAMQNVVEDVIFTVSAYAEDGEEPLREETYYFRLINARLEQEIVDYVMDETDFVVNIINYKHVDDPRKLPAVPDRPSRAANVGYLTDTIVIPKSAILPDFGNKTLEFDTEIIEKAAGLTIFESERGTDLDTEEVEGVVVTTLTPLADYEPDADNIDDLATEIEGLSAKKLYNYITYQETELVIEVTAKMLDDDGVYKTNKKQYYFNLVEANVDEEISDHIIDENALINVVDYEDTDEVKSIAALADKENARYPIEHLKETLIIPEEIVLPEYGNKTINVTSNVTEKSGLLDPNFFETTQSREIEEGDEVFDLTVKTLTPLGSYINPNPNITLEALADDLMDLPTKQLYDHSQHVDMDVDITLTLELGSETRTKTYYFTLIKADFDEKISEALLDEQILYVADYDFKNNPVPLSAKNAGTPQEIEYLRDTILIPIEFLPAEYPEKTFELVPTYSNVDHVNGSDALFYVGNADNDEITHEGNKITVTGLFPTAGFSGIHQFDDDLEGLLGYISDIYSDTPPMHLLQDAIDLAFHVNSLQDTKGFELTLTAKIDGVPYKSVTYYFDINKPEAPSLPGNP
ncbi:MAG TPA: hypothetical protein VFD05_00695 [Bacilli bacterium]|nr:hypothetical protein [Bacilli bacterium]